MSARPPVLVLGGGGFVGSHLCGALLGAGYGVRAFGTARRGWGNLDHLGGRVERVQGDVADADAVRGAAAGCEVAIHVAGATLPADSAATAARDVGPAMRFWPAAGQLGLRHLVLISSGGTIYGRAERLPVAEDHPTRPISPYGELKRTLEMLLALEARAQGLPWTILRLANVYGERQSPDGTQGAVAVFLGRVLAGRPIEIFGEGDLVRDYVHADDVGRALLSALEAVEPERIFNVGTGVGTSLVELAAAIGRVTGRAVEIERRPARPVDVPANVLDASRLRRATGWKPEVDLEAGIRRTAAWIAGAARK